MIHEIILSLMGNVGTFLEKEFSKYENVEDLSYFHPCEVHLVKELLTIASDYRKIKVFYDQYGQYNLESNESLQKGMYLTAFATAVYKETKSYNMELVNIDSEISKDSQPSIAALVVRLQPYKYIFKGLNCIISMVVNKKVHGCKILEVAHLATRESVGNLGGCFERIEQSVNDVYFNQIINWILFGALWDPHEELFIKLVPSKLNKSNYINIDKEKKINMEVESYFDMLPDHIPLSIAEKIIFIGESILLFEQEKIISDKLFSHKLVKMEEDCIKELRVKLGGKKYLLKSFSDEIEKIRECLAKHLYDLVINSGFINELDNFKKIYLLGRGELYQAFFNIAGHLVDGNVSSAVNINGLFRKSGQQLNFEESFLEKFHWSIQHAEGAPSEDKGWNDLSVNYLAEWPLHKIFNQRVQERYNEIMRFLFSIQRAQYRLQYLWISQKQTKSTNEAFFLRWTLRHHMNLLIYNLQYYIQVDVLECQYLHLIQEIKQESDYQQLIISHNNFITSIETQCFLNHSVLHASIQLILGKIHEFCDLITSENSDELETKIAALQEDFDRTSGKFFWVLSNLGTRETSRHTSQLIMRIDYNKFYSQKSSAKRFFEHGAI